jgi:hypothetical protein
MARNPFDPKSKEPFPISRSKIDLFLECPRCFWLDLRQGVSRPSMPAFTLNSAVDELLKKEFDIHRAKGNPHPLMKEYHIDAIPLAHEKIDEWRNTFRGIRYHEPKTNFILFGAIDDLWQNPQKELYVVDYKSTSTTKKISLEDQYKQGYKKQAEFYQWLLRQNGFKVSDTAYFVFCNGRRDKEAFDGKLEFNVEIIAYEGSDKWISKTIVDVRTCLKQNEIPKSGEDCQYCNYIQNRSKYS